MRKVLGSIFGFGILLSATTALAQETPSTTEPPKTTVAAGAGAPAAAKKDDGITDHEKVVGKFGVGYFGVTQQPIGQGAPAAVTTASVSTPVIGVRYWMAEKMGIDVGLGFNFFSSGSTVEASGKSTDTAGPAVLAFAVHGGLPLVFAYGKHYKFLGVPELNFGYATQTEQAQNVPAGTVTPADIKRHGLRLDLGGRVGTEIQFGFIGIPELALQASVGLNIRYQSWGNSQDAYGTVPASSSSRHATNFGTTVQSDPWALFTNNISAIYYLP